MTMIYIMNPSESKHNLPEPFSEKISIAWAEFLEDAIFNW